MNIDEVTTKADPASSAPAPMTRIEAVIGGMKMVREMTLAEVPKCPTCAGLRIVATAWPSGYPHATPCPECRPNDPCECVGTTNCPSAEAVAAWKAAHRPAQDDAIRAAVAAERERCLAWASALRRGEIDDARSLILAIGSGDNFEDEPVSEPAPTVKP